MRFARQRQHILHVWPWHSLKKNDSEKKIKENVYTHTISFFNYNIVNFFALNENLVAITLEHYEENNVL